MTNSTPTVGPFRIGDAIYYSERRARIDARITDIWSEIDELQAFKGSRGTLGKGLDRQIATLRNELNELLLRIPNNTDPIDWSVN